jgi:hypothetical protein
MSNTIRLRPEDLDRRDALYQRFKAGTITHEQIIDLRHILQNERYQAILDGNIDMLFTITSMIEKIDSYMRREGISPSTNVRLANL